MRRLILILVLFNASLAVTAQEYNDILDRLPVKDGTLLHQLIIDFDSTVEKRIVYDAIKKTLIKSTNYKSAKVDEDRTAGNITTEIRYYVNSKPKLLREDFLVTSKVSFDVRDTKFRIQLYQSQMTYMNIVTPMEDYFVHAGKGKKSSKIFLNDWNKVVLKLMEFLRISVEDEIKNNDF